MSNIKNYTEQGGERTVITGELSVERGGKLLFNGAELKLMPEILTSTASSLDGLKADFNTLLAAIKTAGLMLDVPAALMPQASFDYLTRILTITGGVEGQLEYRTDTQDSTPWISLSGDFINLSNIEEGYFVVNGYLIYIRNRGDGGITCTASETLAVTSWNRKIVPLLSGTDSSGSGAGDGYIIITNFDPTAQYRIATDLGGPWTDPIITQDGKIENLGIGMYYMKVLGDSTGFASEVSASVFIGPI